MSLYVNLGCGSDIIHNYDNLDMNQVILNNDKRVRYGDAHKLDYNDQSVDLVLIKGPRYHPLETDVPRILKTEGELIIIGSFSNLFVERLWPFVDEGKTRYKQSVLEYYKQYGFNLIGAIQPPDKPEHMISKRSDGTIIKAATLKQITLRKGR